MRVNSTVRYRKIAIILRVPALAGSPRRAKRGGPTCLPLFLKSFLFVSTTCHPSIKTAFFQNIFWYSCSRVQTRLFLLHVEIDSSETMHTLSRESDKIVQIRPSHFFSFLAAIFNGEARLLSQEAYRICVMQRRRARLGPSPHCP